MFALFQVAGVSGETVWFDWQPSRGDDFWLAGIHLSGTLFCCEGGDPGQTADTKVGEWIYLFRPEWREDDRGTDKPEFIKLGLFRSDRLGNMKHTISAWSSTSGSHLPASW